MSVRIRHACDDDLPALVNIYNHYVEHSPATFDTRTFSTEEKRDWLNGYSADGPYRLLVAEAGEAVVGYASSSRFKSREAYKTSVETTIYLHPDAAGKGVGAVLYRELVDMLRADDRLHRAYAGIALPNDASVRLHEMCGFRLAGTYREVGYKFGRYWDVAWYECDLD